MLEEYEWDKKDESKEKEANCQKDVESGSCFVLLSIAIGTWTLNFKTQSEVIEIINHLQFSKILIAKFQFLKFKSSFKDKWKINERNE